MTDIEIFIVYHKNVHPDKIFKSCYTEDIIRKNFTFFGVNELHSKNIVNNKNYKNVIEYDLPIYNPFLQKRGYMETSVYLHVFWNKLYKDKEYVGFCQYDMTHDKPLPKLENNKIIIEWTTNNIVSNNTWHNWMHPTLRNCNFLMDSYNKHFNKNHTKKDLEGLPFSLWQTNIYPTHIFEKLCRWLEILCDEIWVLKYNGCESQTHWGVIGGFTERAIAIFNVLEIKQGIKWQTWGLGHFKELAEEKFQYNHHHWINQFDLNIHINFEKIIEKNDNLFLDNFDLVEKNDKLEKKLYFIRENINNITHLFMINNKIKSKAIMIYLPEDCNLFKKKYLSLHDNLEKCNIYYKDTVLIINKNNKYVIFNLQIHHI